MAEKQPNHLGKNHNQAVSPMQKMHADKNLALVIWLLYSRVAVSTSVYT